MAEFIEIVNDAVISAFEQLGGDARQAVNSASQYTLDEWVGRQQAQVIAAGTGANLVPGAHALALTADMAFLIHKMAHTSWGIGGIMGCEVFGKPDFVNILDVWTGRAVNELDYWAVSTPFYHGVRQIMQNKTYWSPLEWAAIDAVDPYVLCNEIYYLISEDAQAFEEFSKVISSMGDLSPSEIANAAPQDEAILRDLTTRAANQVVSKMNTGVVGRLVPALAGQVAAKLVTRLATKAVTGFVPLLGAVVGGGLNYWFIQSIAQSARIYYGHAIMLADDARA